MSGEVTKRLVELAEQQLTQQTDAQRLDGYETASLNEIIAQLESCEYECIAGPLYNNIAFIEVKKRAYQLDAANQTIADLQWQLRQADKYVHDWRDSQIQVLQWKRKADEQNQLMLSALERIRDRILLEANGDIITDMIKIACDTLDIVRGETNERSNNTE